MRWPWPSPPPLLFRLADPGGVVAHRTLVLVGAGFTAVPAVWATAPAAAPASHKAAIRWSVCIVMAFILARIGTGPAPNQQPAAAAV
jgi:hypothetical protein